MSRCALALVAGAVPCGACGGEGAEGVDPSLIQTVVRGDLPITVRERCEINAARDTRIESELERRSVITWLIPEGTIVEAGEKVAELDVSEIVDRRAEQAIAVARAEAAFEQARKSLEIVEKELKAAERTAETRLEIARLRLEKFLGQERPPGHGSTAAEAAARAEPESDTVAGTNAEMVSRLRELVEEVPAGATQAAAGTGLVDRLMEILGSEDVLAFEMGEMANHVLEQIDKISLARSDLKMADQTLFHSRKLSEKGFITTNELERDEINYQRQLSTQTVAWNNLLLLVNYTLPETLLTLELEVENAQLNLESVRAANDARRVRVAAELESVESEFELAKEQLESWDAQIENGVLRAPGPGLVVYGRWDWDEPVFEGMEVWKGFEVIILPDISKMMARIRIPESQIGKVAVGQRAVVRIDAFPTLSFSGEVSRVSSLPDPGPRSQTVKVYLTDVLIDGDNFEGKMRPGMNGMVTIDIGTLRDVISVPLPAIDRRGDVQYVWKETPEGPEAVEVGLGANSLTHVEVLSGLAEGDRVYLVRPRGARLPDQERPVPEQDEADVGQEPLAQEGEPARSASGESAPDSGDAGLGSQ